MSQPESEDIELPALTAATIGEYVEAVNGHLFQENITLADAKVLLYGVQVFITSLKLLVTNNGRDSSSATADVLRRQNQPGGSK